MCINVYAMASANPNEEEKENENLIYFKELDIKNLEDLYSKFPIIYLNFPKFVADSNARHVSIRQHLGIAYNVKMRLEARRLKSFIPGHKLSSWAPTEMASAGLYFTGVDNSMQCFCCGIVLCCTSLKLHPHEEHLHFSPSCGFIQGKDVGNVSKYEVRVQTSETGQECLQAYSTEEARLSSFTNWPFYSRIQPVLLARAGFYFTGRRDIVQCFSCDGCLGHWEENDDPWKEHAKWFPECEFLTSKKTPDEIKVLNNSYNGYHGIQGKHFLPDVIDNVQSCQLGNTRMNIFEDENVRLESFKKWPTDSKGDPAAFARAGFFYTGKSGEVRCYLCSSSVNSSEHLFMLSIENHVCQFLVKKQTESKDLETQIKENKEGVHKKVSSYIVHDEFCPVEAMELRKSLIELYTDFKFRKLLPFPGSSHVSIDLNSHFADISVESKTITNRALGVLTLPDILSELTDITMIEGETGSGKTALLKKIAVLWASGSCPILSRFSLVFYISLPSIGNKQTLSDIICQQLIGSSTSITEKSLGEIIKQLKNRVLFLLDDYGVMDSLPGSIEELIKMNHWNRLTLAVTVNPHKGRNLRQYARVILGIQDFPIYSSIFIFKNIFSHDLTIVNKICMELTTTVTLQLVLRSPLLTFCLCVLWVQDPAINASGDTLVWKSYLMHVMLRHPTEVETVNAVVSSCEELAIESLFKLRFKFTHEDLREYSVNVNEALRFRLLSMFTSQRLHPVFKFFHPSFQEFLAGKRMNELLQSGDVKENQRGLSFLQNINTISKVTGRFFYFLKYTCMHSPETSVIVLSHVFSLLDSREAFHCQSDEKIHLQHHPELDFMEGLLNLQSLMPLFDMGTNNRDRIDSILDMAIKIAEESSYLSHCVPIILNFLKGKTISIVLSWPNRRLLRFLYRYPEGLWLLERLEIVVPPANISININTEIFRPIGSVPEVDADYSNAFKLASDLQQKARMPFLDYLGTNIYDLSTLGFSPDIHRIPLLTVKVHGCPVESDNILVNIMFFCSISIQVGLDLFNCPGFLESMWPCIDLYKSSIKSLSIRQTKLFMEDQELVTLLTALQSLKIVLMPPPEFVLSNIHSFKELKELVVDCPIDDNKWEIIDVLSDEFKSLHNMEKIVFKNIRMERQADRLANFIENFRNLISFTLKCKFCPGLKNIVDSLSRCGKMQELRFLELALYDLEIIHLASALSSFTNLKILEIEFYYSVKVEATKKFAEGLAYLEQLEEFTFPGGSAVKENISHFIQALQHMPNLRTLTIQCRLLNDSSLLELAKITADGHLRNLQKVDLSHNPDITQSGWRDFFLLLDNLPKLTDLNISRFISQYYITDPVTFIALTHCVSRLHSLNVLSMFGWLLDDKDIEMFDSMKMKHPQSKWFNLFWKWTLPFPPVVTR
ncbi:baculoviral IAP repeat-containing protein 1-like isoform X2 [Hyla sarda]|uniref:baculoviral IAP repeat-containing protein 1-like isoform X2 n=1 Tax=Hyla sarda TaxID=327740 RepID=UPI0024C3BF26|nr:baculoviral IAP repeat-containing protein 1-like isoform X2 [Hyla sarda]